MFLKIHLFAEAFDHVSSFIFTLLSITEYMHTQKKREIILISFFISEIDKKITKINTYITPCFLTIIICPWIVVVFLFSDLCTLKGNVLLSLL